MSELLIIGNLDIFTVVIIFFLIRVRFDKVLARVRQKILRVQFYLGHCILESWKPPCNFGGLAMETRKKSVLKCLYKPCQFLSLLSSDPLRQATGDSLSAH